MTISVIIITRNEELNLPFSLGSVCSWADEIIVVDMCSEDRTVELARSHGCQVINHPIVPGFVIARQAGIDAAKGDWLLILDADEMITPKLAVRLREISNSQIVDMVYLPRVNYVLGVAFKATGFGPAQDYQLRFFRSGMLIVNEKIHDGLQAATSARLIHLPADVDAAIAHFCYLDVSHIIDKNNRYTSAEVIQRFGAKPKGNVRSMIFRALLEFPVRFIRLRGYRDGWQGLAVSLLMTMYWALVALKGSEFAKGLGRERVGELYRQRKMELLRGFGDLDTTVRGGRSGD